MAAPTLNLLKPDDLSPSPTRPSPKKVRRSSTTRRPARGSCPMPGRPRQTGRSRRDKRFRGRSERRDYTTHSGRDRRHNDRPRLRSAKGRLCVYPCLTRASARSRLQDGRSDPTAAVHQPMLRARSRHGEPSASTLIGLDPIISSPGCPRHRGSAHSRTP